MSFQRSVSQPASVRGRSLHSGIDVELRLLPAPARHGIRFRRTDLPGAPELKPDVNLVKESVRSTSIAEGPVLLQTIEHLLSALSGCGVDNAIVELDAAEPPILDGSAAPFVDLIDQAGLAEQNAPREALRVRSPVTVSQGESSLIALPHDGFKISCTSSDNQGFHTQHIAFELSEDVYRKEIAAARTFVFHEDIERLQAQGLIQGGSMESAIVIREGEVLSPGPLRFPDEFARHKMLDLIGDLALLGVPLRAHIIAIRPGHALNAEFCRALRQHFTSAKPRRSQSPGLDETQLDIGRILETMPHRYPFLMIDRVLEMTADNELVAIKNVTINEPYFIGHFPQRPVMPGVLQVEAMAQAAGILLMRAVQAHNVIAYFMSCDKVKFRRSVVPGDQVEVRVKLLKVRQNRIGVAAGECRVDGQMVSSAELMFTLASADEAG